MSDDRSPLSEPDETALTEPDETALTEPDETALIEPDSKALAEPDERVLTEPDETALPEPDRVQLADSDVERSPEVVESSTSPDVSTDPDAEVEVPAASREASVEKNDEAAQEGAETSSAPADSDPPPPTGEPETGGEKDDRTRWQKVADTAEAFGKAGLGTAFDIVVPGGDGYTVDRMVDAWDGGLGQYARTRVEHVARALMSHVRHDDEKGT
ncbi:hypothetical protein WCD74_01260 [Actinomycetospora sp. OC33-EN08]|uniref:Uncharacterized protein n=1 Tax=Actinomycetospora aurantiaca TaxID=3129233 RepID=A0ABU8MGB4_9PSEU